MLDLKSAIMATKQQQQNVFKQDFISVYKCLIGSHTKIIATSLSLN